MSDVVDKVSAVEVDGDLAIGRALLEDSAIGDRHDLVTTEDCV